MTKNTYPTQADSNLKILRSRFIKQQAIRGYSDTIVCSYGGVGTSFLISFVEKYKAVNSRRDRDRIKHLDRPPIVLNKNFKAVYVLGNPFDAVISLFRRNMHHRQSKKLLANYPNLTPVEPSCTFQEYVEHGVDKFKLNEHFQNWKTAKVNYPIMLIKYESIWKHLPELLDYLEISLSEIEHFPKEKQRKSDWNSLPERSRKLLYKMYGNLYEEIVSIEDVKLLEPSFPSHIFLPKYVFLQARQLCYDSAKKLLTFKP